MLRNAVGTYFWQLFWQGLVLGSAAYLCLLAPGRLKIVFLVLGLYLFWRIPKDPRTHWKRMFSVVMGVTLIGGGIEVVGNLGVEVPPWLHLQAIGRYMPDTPPWLLFGLAALAVLADIWPELGNLRKSAKDGRVWGRSQLGWSVITSTSNAPGFSARGEVTVEREGGTVPLRVTEVTSRLRGLWWVLPTKSVVYAGATRDTMHGGLGEHAIVQPGGALHIRCDVTVTGTLKSCLLFWWRRADWPLLPRIGSLSVQLGGSEGAQLNVATKFAALGSP